MAFVAATDVSALIGFTLSTTTRPTQASVEGMISRSRIEAEGVFETRGVKVPVNETNSPRAFAQLFDRVLDYVAARTLRAHHAVLDEIPTTLLKDIREREDKWRVWLSDLAADKGRLDDAEMLTHYPDCVNQGEVLASNGSVPYFKVSDEY